MLDFKGLKVLVPKARQILPGETAIPVDLKLCLLPRHFGVLAAKDQNPKRICFPNGKKIDRDNQEKVDYCYSMDSGK
jgi:hypothetical protein